MFADTPSPDSPFTTRDLDRLGLSRRALRRLVAEGVVRRVAHGAYVPAHLAESVDVRARAIALVVAPGQVVRDRTAAWIHGIDTFTYAEHDLAPPIETCALRGREPTVRQGVAGRTRDLAEGDVMEIDALRVTTPLRTALDLGCLLRRADAMAALDAFCRHHDLSSQQLAAEARRFRRRRGVVQLRELIGLIDPKAESIRESWTRLAIHDAGLPAPESQVWIDVDGLRTYRLDFAYRRRRVAVEYDGLDAHEGSPDQIAYDRARRAWLRENGWTVIVVRSGDFTGENLVRWIRDLREALAPEYTNVRRLERNSRLMWP